jgi:hypothetical protein
MYRLPAIGPFLFIAAPAFAADEKDPPKYVLQLNEALRVLPPGPSAICRRRVR